ncbi:MAG: STAS domain-containing protein [Chloracidobacterium sp.]|nr:STAS domain-containing protein [Chloracidobacterium sp.]MDW8217502.1 STAS domain-containing protein [Acidobacteriota bacterium]
MSNEVFKVTSRQAGNAIVIAVEGYINNLAGEKILDEFNRRTAEGHRRFVLNLEKTQLVNSIGVSILIEMIEKAQELNGSIAFCCLLPIIAKTFKIMGLTQYAQVYETEAEALAG